jgi:hypothetical protein
MSVFFFSVCKSLGSDDADTFQVVAVHEFTSSSYVETDDGAERIIEDAWRVWVLCDDPVFMGEALAVLADQSGGGVFAPSNRVLSANDALRVGLVGAHTATLVFEIIDDAVTPDGLAAAVLSLMEAEYLLSHEGKTDTPYSLVAVLQNADGTITVVYESVDATAARAAEAVVAREESQEGYFLVDGAIVQTFGAVFDIAQIQPNAERGDTSSGLSAVAIVALVVGLLCLLALVVLLVMLMWRRYNQQQQQKQVDDAVKEGKYGSDELVGGETGGVALAVGGLETAGMHGATDGMATDHKVVIHDAPPHDTGEVAVSGGEDTAAKKLAAAKERHKQKHKKLTDGKHKKKKKKKNKSEENLYLPPLASSPFHPEVKSDNEHTHKHKHAEHNEHRYSTAHARRSTHTVMQFDDDSGPAVVQAPRRRSSLVVGEIGERISSVRNKHAHGYQEGRTSDYGMQVAVHASALASTHTHTHTHANTQPKPIPEPVFGESSSLEYDSLEMEEEEEDVSLEVDSDVEILSE